MTAEKYLVCGECKSYVYVCKNGRLESRPQEMNDIAAFIEDHEFNCEGNMSVWDESGVPPSEPKPDGDMHERIWPYKNYSGRGRKP